MSLVSRAWMMEQRGISGQRLAMSVKKVVALWAQELI